MPGRVMVAGMEEFRHFLQNELVKRCQANPRYSLRAFARTLSLESSALSKILAGKRAVTPTTLRRISGRLALSPGQVRGYESGLRERRGRKAISPAETVPAYQALSLDAFQVIADWYHFAILELTSTQGFRPEPRWIARKLSISVVEVSAAVERLRRLGFLEGWTDRSNHVTCIQDEFTASAHRKLQKQILEKAITALEEIPISRRDTTAMTMAIDSDRLKEAKRRIKEFRRELCAYLQGGKKKDHVYHLSLALYPVTKSSGEET